MGAISNNLEPILTDYIYHKNKKGKPCQNGSALKETIKLLISNLFFEIFSWFKSNDVFALNLNLFTCLWISSHSGFSIYILECSKAY